MNYRHHQGFKGTNKSPVQDNLHLVKHRCTLPEKNVAGKHRLPPNAPIRRRLGRWIHKAMTPDPNLAISERNFRNDSQIKAEIRRQASHKNWYVIHPYSRMEAVRELYYIVYFIWIVVVAGPMVASFEWMYEYRPQFTPKDRNRCYLCPYPFFLATTFLWIVSCFFSAYEGRPQEKGRIELSVKKIAERYLKSFFFIDIFIILPCPLSDTRLCIYLWCRCFIMFIRICTFYKYVSRFTEDFKIPTSVTHCILQVYISLILTHLYTCLFYTAPVLTYTTRQKLWIINNKLMDYSGGIMYYSLYAIVQSHFWGLGDSSIDTENCMEEFVLIIVMVTGRLWGLYILASLLRVFSVSSLSESGYEQYVKHLKIFISHNNMPKEMEQRILEYYEYKFQNHFFNETAIFTTISLHLRQAIKLFYARNVIHKVQVFKFFPQSIIAEIIGKCRVVVHLNNDYIIKEGDVCDHVYFISSGTVAVYNEDKYELIHLHDGDEFGLKGLGASEEVKHDFSFVAIETTTLYAITIKEFREIIYTRDDVLDFFKKKLEERIKLWERLEKYVTVQRDDVLTELRNEKILERPSVKTRFYEK